jgi:hypothetical protein
MPPKSGKEKPAPIEQEEVIQAVILADSFNSRFKPLSTNKPRVWSPPRCTCIAHRISCFSSCYPDRLFFLYAIYHCLTGHWNVLSARALRRYMSFAAHMRNKSRRLLRTYLSVHGVPFSSPRLTNSRTFLGRRAGRSLTRVYESLQL